MSLNDTVSAHEPVTPEGCIAAIPPQSTRSCELVITTLANELERVNFLLSRALEVYVHPWDTPDEVRDECVFTTGWRSAEQLLKELRADWPHLDI